MAHEFLQRYSGLRASHLTFDENNKPTLEPHCHESHELLYVLHGEGKYIVEGVEYPLRPQSLFLMHPYEYHYVAPSLSHTYERIVFHFDASLLPDCLRDHPMLTQRGINYFHLKSMNSPFRNSYAMLDEVTALSNGGEESTPEAEAFLRSAITQILLLLARETPQKTDVVENGTVLQIIDYLNRHLCEDLSLEALAHEFFISKYYLCRIFRAQTGASIYTYFTTKRMALARQMITNGEAATTAATALGFRDYSSFYRAYRKQFGEAPVRTLR